MSIDGVFIHNLVNELKIIEKKRINKIYDINEREFLFYLSNKLTLVGSLNLTYPHLRLTTKTINTLSEPTNFCMVLRKHFEHGIIDSINQYNNDRIIIIKVLQADELGYQSVKFLIFELLGRHANLILTNEDMIIIDCLRKTPLDSMRLLVPKVTYQFPTTDKLNPYTVTTDTTTIDNFEGLSNIIKNEIKHIKSLHQVLYRPVKPTLIKLNDKYNFYWTDLLTLSGEKQYFKSISSLLDYYYTEISEIFLQKEANRKLVNYINHEIKKTTSKISKQEIELSQAKDNLIYEKLGNLLASNLHKVNKGDNMVIVEDYYEGNNLIELKLDPKLSPSQNLEAYFNKYKKAQRTISILTEEIKKSFQHLQYLQTLQEQIQLATEVDLEEIALELGLKEQSPKKKTKVRPNYLTFTDTTGNLIFVGKNNIQNNYLTHTLANKNDYFFHVKDAPGSHVIVRTNNLTDELIGLAAQLAAYYSNYHSKTTVDYTLVKYVKKVKGMPGSFVIYTNQKSVTVTPNKEYFLGQLKEVNHDK